VARVVIGVVPGFPVESVAQTLSYIPMLVEMTEMWTTSLDAKGARSRSVASSREVVGCRFKLLDPMTSLMRSQRVTHDLGP